MKRLLLPLLVGLAVPTAAIAGLSFDEKREICARYWGGQITHQDAASGLSLKESIHKEIGYLKKDSLRMVSLLIAFTSKGLNS